MFMSAVVFSSGMAFSAPIHVTLVSDSFDYWAISPPPGASLRLQAIPNATTTLLLPGPEPDDVDRMLNYQIGDPASFTATIRKDQAAAIGFDWDAFENGLLGYNRTIRLQFNLTSSPSQLATVDVSGAIRANLPSPSTYLYRFTDFEMEEIRLKVDYYFWHPILTTLRASKVSFEIEGSGNVVPEPTTLFSLMFAGILMGQSRRRRSRR